MKSDEKKTDRRIVKTRKSISRAFETLLHKKSYSKITVQDIIDEADIGRSTFYAHFDTKDNLLAEMSAEIFDHVLYNYRGPEETHNFKAGSKDLHQMFSHLLYHFKEDGVRFKGIFAGESSSVFWDKFKEQLAPLVEARISELPMEERGTMPQELLSYIMVDTFVDVTKWWFRNGMVELPEEVEEYFENIMKGRPLGYCFYKR